MKVTITLNGTAPLLLHNAQLSNPINPIVREMKLISAKRKKTDDDHAELARLEFLGGLYHADDIGPYLPGANIEKSLVEGGRITKQGKQVERGLFVIDNESPLIYHGPRTPADLFADPNYVSSLSVKVGTSRIMRTRPMFREWCVEATAELDPGLLSVEQLQQIADDAGAMVGLGDFRPRYGRYTATIQPA